MSNVSKARRFIHKPTGQTVRGLEPHSDFPPGQEFDGFGRPVPMPDFAPAPAEWAPWELDADGRPVDPPPEP